MPQVLGRRKTRSRTSDVFNCEEVSFSKLFLSDSMQKGLFNAGFLNPSPVQAKAIPVGLMGVDVIIQAKSGTGKTLVFSVISIESIDLLIRTPQVLILAPTREIAEQIHQVILSLTKDFEPPVYSMCAIGGISIHEDLQKLKYGVHIVVGTPGRVLDLLQSSSLDSTGIKLFILDEADKLLDDSFSKQVFQVLEFLPQRKQFLALSATFPADLIRKVSVKMKEPQKILISEDSPSLEGVKQYYHLVNLDENDKNCNLSIQKEKLFKQKGKQLLKLLSKLRFHQCLVFCNQQHFAQKLCKTLTKYGWTNSFISGAQAQTERQNAMEHLRTFSIRVLVSTDLTARGVDVEKVNLVMNLDVPSDPETYMHRIGRTGRFGTYGVAVSFVTSNEYENLEKIQQKYSTKMEKLPESISPKFYAYTLDNEDDELKLKDMEEYRQNVKKQRLM